jgi:protein-tyrosine phosphatase
MMMDQHVSFESCFNFRDLGGYLTTDGRTVRWGCVFRSGSLRLTPADFAVLQRLHVRTVIDLRSTRELESEGRSGYLGELDYHHVPLFEQEALPFRPFEVGRPDPPQGEMYLSIAVACGDSVARCLRTIAECDHAVVFHCAAGRDRTGIVAAMLLASLGVPDETIVTDYALSDQALEPWLTWAKVNDTKLAADIEALPNSLLTASPQSMIFLLEGVRSSYGSIEKYLVGIGAGADVVGALRSRLLE